MAIFREVDGSDPVRIELGPLKGNKGNQQYPIPPGTDVTKYRTAVIWSGLLSLAYGRAPMIAR